MLEREKFIKKYLNEFVPYVISNIISEYADSLIGKCELTLKAHYGSPVIECAILSDAQLITRSYDKVFKIWNICTKKCEGDLKGLGGWYTPAYNLQNGLVSWSEGNTLKISNIHYDGQIKNEFSFKGHTDWVRCCAKVPNCDKIVSGSYDRTLKIWNTKTEKCELTLTGHTAGVLCCAILPDHYNYRIISSSIDKTLKIWNIQTILPQGNCDLTLEGHTDYVSCCAVLSDKYVVSGSHDCTLKIWNVQTVKLAGKCELTLKGHTQSIYCCAKLSNCKIVSGSADGTLKIWNIYTDIHGNLQGNCELTLNGHKDTVTFCKVLHDGRIVSGSYDGKLKIWS